MIDRRLVYAVLAVAAIVGLFFLFRPRDDEAGGGAGATTVRPTTAAPATTSPTTSEPTPTIEPAVTRWRVDARDDRLDRLSVPRGKTVRLVVIADTSDHVHVHGYDLMQAVAPGAPAVIQFSASIAGRFEIELEERGREIAQLTVEP